MNARSPIAICTMVAALPSKPADTRTAIGSIRSEKKSKALRGDREQSIGAEALGQLG